MKYTNGLKLLSRPYRVPAIVASAATINHVYKTTRSGFMPESNARSSLSEKALIDFPVLVLLRNQNKRMNQINT